MSSFEILRSACYKRQAWRNGQGYTDEIVIEPRGVNFADGNFLFRISSAEIKTEGDFSVFPRHLRIISILRGAGIVLVTPESKKLTVGEIFAFDGAAKTSCTLVSGPVKDFNVIFDRDSIIAEGKMSKVTTPTQLCPKTNGWLFLYVLSGQLKIGGREIADPGDTIQIKDSVDAETIGAMCEVIAVDLVNKNGVLT